MIGRILHALGLERRVTDYNPAFAPDTWGRAFHPGSGLVSATAVLSNLAVAHRCIELKATLLGSTPLKVFRRLPNGGRERVRDHPLSRTLNRPNEFMTRFEFIELLSRALDLHGNFYARIERDGAGRVRELHPLEPHTVTIERTASGRLRYKVSASNGQPAAMLLADEVLHVKISHRMGSWDGVPWRQPRVRSG